MIPNFTGRSLFDFNIVATAIRNRLYHFGSQGHFIASLGAINIAVYDALEEIHSASQFTICSVAGSLRLRCRTAYATTGYFTDHPDSEIERQLSRS